VSSIIPTGVCGETDEAGDVDSEYDGSGVSGVVGGVRYDAFVGLVGIDGGGGVDFGGEAWRGPNEGIGLVLVFGAIAGKGLVDVAASFEIVCRTYVGYGPGPAKSLRTISSNSVSVDGSTLSSQSKY